ncbi:MAG: hypothetical protein COW11_04840 [Candidatus Omnitrophica bacterium CG12_big_fil_rev_8_21_14_0_65_43_15]|uniref:Hydrogenase nickel incorporation protein HypA n=1 Tax=Candidatus Taenaricola geysiri TaxID=1974752 RepID=A0A2J0LN91_9BACT|nr:MAG: hypothetical protein AUJ89_04785 [Candidatus Omnitrophica bacterium CG1_02_43_210]PIR65543.1 MAG: hypothetical protein COU52_03665 [Candidatus Omnitrophica bacterium CG10_big_fil_rev_8_21_14_0_10_43_8]PIV12537.1 MAG: hypothetical protein COS48_00420 [Candidatus Omnitrophica bacterium CG03_land_8_20_14_0_80_43_22]PIW66196.1 MAG: hypothetical protein COW11_04840 [Candidatus Omnitrophica bacterium CG12_big_fil_rev_8_21_14_0_65_43_15]PIW80254.1 MAG: hypothetical protein COZ98_03335 [Candida
MIKIDFALAVSLYVTFFSIGVLFLWVYLNRNKFKIYSSDEVYMWQCDVCTYAYVDSTHKEISACPVCGSYNKRGVKK